MRDKKDKILPEDQKIVDTFFELKEKGKYAAAFDLLSRLKVKYEHNYKIFFLLGTVLYLNNEYKRSIEYLRISRQLNPTYSLTSLTLIHALGNLNKWHSALIELRRFLINEKGSCNDHLLLLAELIESINNFSTSEQALLKKLFNEVNGNVSK